MNKIKEVIESFKIEYNISVRKIQTITTNGNLFVRNVYNDRLCGQLNSLLEYWVEKTTWLGKEVYVYQDICGFELVEGYKEKMPNCPKVKDAPVVLTEKMLDEYIVWHLNFLIAHITERLVRFQVPRSTSPISNIIEELHFEADQELLKFYKKALDSISK